MVKKLVSKVSSWSVALFLVEWCCFIGGILLNSSMWMKVILLSTASPINALYA